MKEWILEAFSNIAGRLKSSEISYLYGSLGIAALLSLSARGACGGMVLCGAAAALQAGRAHVIAISYVAMIIISTGFFYAFIIAISMISAIGGSYEVETGVRHLLAGLLYGSVGSVVGAGMGVLAGDGIRRVAKTPEFLGGFMILLVALEVVLLLAFLCALLMVFTER